MQRVKRSTAVAVLPAPPSGGTPGYFASPNPAGGVPATVPGHEWYNAVQEELCSVIEAFGALNGGVNTQLRDALNTYFAKLSGATFAGPVIGNNQTTRQVGGYVWSDMSGSAGGAAMFGNNCYYSVTDNQMHYTATHPSLGARGLVLIPYVGLRWFDTGSNATTAGQVFTPTLQAFASPASVQGAFKNLQLSTTGLGVSISVSADELVVESSGNAYETLRNVNLTTFYSNGATANGLDTGSLAASTWYSVWVIYNGSITAGLLSLSATAPTMPGGYTHKARVGWIRTDSSGNKYPLSMIQLGRSARYKVAAGSNVTALPQMATGVQGSATTPTWVGVAVASFVPTTAAKIGVMMVGALGINNQVGCAPNNSYGAVNTNNSPPIAIYNTSSTQSNQSGDIVLESANIYWASSSAPLICTGWEDNL
jgi:hypothetical protein